MTVTNNTSLLPELKPKNIDVNESLRLSKILISKNWALPSKTTKRSSKVTDRKIKKTNVVSPRDEKKVLQNRDAQRAYRERKANKIKEMEETIESLQKLVIHWKNKYNLKEKELNDIVNSQNVGTHNKIVSTAEIPSTPHNHTQNISVPVPITETKTETEPPTKCGFCNESSSCVCTELEHTDDNNSNNSNSEEQNKQKSISLLPAPVSKKNNEPSMFNCSGSSATCEKCSNIEETCIKPATSTIILESNEIDFTDMRNNNNNNNNSTLSELIKLNNGTTFQRIKRQMK
ncbi:hypothetical protein C6P45_003188 [Maudiozyma exigua]|uniref:BZIP domain-containing protein n=1 Tax=Maudiozyma exigua TaxID=34358 RepID=A0A9P6WCK9_MAUEX|nr:hypothetical protein C6P45_003188 [Kazachstania exigua]